MNIIGNSTVGKFNIVEFYNSSLRNINEFSDKIFSIQTPSNTRSTILSRRPDDLFPAFTQIAPNSGYIIRAKENFTVSADRTQPVLSSRSFAGSSISGLYTAFRNNYTVPINISAFSNKIFSIQTTSPSAETLVVYKPEDAFPAFTQIVPNTGYIISAKENFTISDPTIGATPTTTTTTRAPFIGFQVTPATPTIVDGGNTNFTIVTSGITNGTTLYWKTIVDNDPTSSSVTSGSFTINNNAATFSVGITPKQLGSTNNTTLAVYVSRTSNYSEVIGLSSTIVVLPRYTLTANINALSEGDTVIFTFTDSLGTIPNGTSMSWVWHSSDYNSFAGYKQMSPADGNFTINGGTGTFTSTIIPSVNLPDRPNITNTTFRITHPTLGTILEKTFAIQDTSQISQFHYKLLGTQKRTVYGTTKVYNVITTNVPDGTSLHWSATSSYISQNSGTVLINGGKGSFTINVPSNTRTAVETFDVNLSATSGGVSVASYTSEIGTTSEDVWSTITYMLPAVSEIIEGNSITYNVISSNDTLQRFWGVSGRWDLPTPHPRNISGSVSLTDGIGSFVVNVPVYNSMSNAHIWGIKYPLQILLSADTNFSITHSNLSDTWSHHLYPMVKRALPLYGPIVCNKSGNISIGESITYSFTTNNVQDGTVVYYRIISQPNILTGAVTIYNNIGTFTVDIPTNNGFGGWAPLGGVSIWSNSNFTGSSLTTNNLEVVVGGNDVIFTITPSSTNIIEGDKITFATTCTIPSLLNRTNIVVNGSHLNDIKLGESIIDYIFEGTEQIPIYLRLNDTGTVVAQTTISLTDSIGPQIINYAITNNQPLVTGDIVTLNIGINLPNGTPLYWTNTNFAEGIYPADYILFSDASSSSDGQVTHNGVVFVDNGAINLTLRVVSPTPLWQGNTRSIYLSFAVSDMDYAPNIFITPYITLDGIPMNNAYTVISTAPSKTTNPLFMDEGGAPYRFTVTKPNTVTDNILYWTSPSTDITQTSGSIQLDNNGSGTFEIYANTDIINENSESHIVYIRTGSTSGPIVTSSIFNIRNFNAGNPTYSFELRPHTYNYPWGPITERHSSDVNDILEYDDALITLTTTNIPTGTLVPYTIIPGTGITEGELVVRSWPLGAPNFGGLPSIQSGFSGNFTILHDGKGYLTISSPSGDGAEGVETFTVNAGNASIEVSINANVT